MGMTEISIDAWEDFLRRFPETHLLQTGGWGAHKERFGWQARRFVVEASGGAAGAQVLVRRLPGGLRMAYVARGPVGDPVCFDALWQEIDRLCLKLGCIFLKLEPDLWLEQAPIPPSGFCASIQTIQPPRTIVVDLDGDEDALLGRMKQKTRYNIRLAAKRGVRVHPSADVDTYTRMAEITAKRDGFFVHSRAYYQAVYDIFQPTGQCEVLFAEYEGEPLAGLMVFARGGRAWYLYGASTDAQRDLMPTYLLQWEAMRWARQKGCRTYDLWGTPDEDESVLEANFTRRSDGLWGVYRFKRGFGGRVMRTAGPWDRVYRPLLYRGYSWWMKRRATEGEAK
jgi:lipid II:glycine glycyltransferase (peptidoglycan interpeptide bridge formation enzyme)